MKRKDMPQLKQDVALRARMQALLADAGSREPKAPPAALARWDRELVAKKPAPKEETVVEVMDIISAMWGVSAQSIGDQLRAAKGGPVIVQINSPGGDVFEGIAIYNLLRAHKGPVRVHVVGLAASAASVIAMAGDEIVMDESANMMIHNVWGVMIGNKADAEEFMQLLKTQDDNLAAIYAARTGRDKAEVAAMMDKETWMTGKQALQEKFTDKVIPNKEGDDGKSKEGGKGNRSAAASGRGAAVHLSASRSKPGDSGIQMFNLIKEQQMKKPIAEQIASFEAKRQANNAQMEALMDKANDEGRSLEKSEGETYDGLKAENVQIDEHLGRLKDMQVTQARSATTVDRGANGLDVEAQANAAADAVRVNARGSDRSVITVASNVPKGTAFTRFVAAMALSKGNIMQAIAMAESRQDWRDTTPVVLKALKAAAVQPGTTTDGSWAAPLVDVQMMADEFIELLRPATIIGRMQGFRRVPFNVKMPRQLTGSTVGWVGQGAPKPVSRLTFDTVSLGFAKVAGIVVITQELARLSTPAAEGVVRQDLIDTIVQFQDEQFINPSVAAVANVSPASITNGVTPVVSAGSSVEQIDAAVQGAMQGFVDAKINLAKGVWIMNPRTALSLSMKRTASGEQKAYPDITPQGGTFYGLPVITSESVPVAGTSGSPTIIVLANASDILLADDGGIAVDVSSEASLQMDSAPETGGQAELVSLWQMNLLGVRAERWINYYKRRTAAVQYISEVEF